jgi:hypothetical protein
MSEIVHLAPRPLARGRQTKFTPEKIRQINNLVERGKSREEIAELVGVTVGTLQVTCSKLGISLRRPMFNNGTRLLRQGTTRCPGDNPSQDPSRQRNTSAQANKDEPQQALQQQATQVSLAVPRSEGCTTGNAASAVFSLNMQYKGEGRSTELPLTHDMIKQLAFEAAFRNMKIGEFVAKLIATIIKEDLFEQVLKRDRNTRVAVAGDRIESSCRSTE